jgi:2Fe-2S ferredoxin
MSIDIEVIVLRYTGRVPKVTILPEGRTVEFESGELPYSEHGKPESLLDVCLNAGIHLEHACGGNCACTTCHIIVQNGGDDNLSEMEDDEADRLDMAPGLTLHSRLGCQAVVKGDVIVEIPAWNRNYVSEGGGSMNLGNAIPPPKRTDQPGGAQPNSGD